MVCWLYHTGDNIHQHSDDFSHSGNIIRLMSITNLLSSQLHAQFTFAFSHHYLMVMLSLWNIALKYKIIVNRWQLLSSFVSFHVVSVLCTQYTTFNKHGLHWNVYSFMILGKKSCCDSAPSAACMTMIFDKRPLNANQANRMAQAMGINIKLV